MPSDKKNTAPKPRAEKYEAKLAIKGTFEQTIKAAFVKDKPKPKS